MLANAFQISSLSLSHESARDSACCKRDSVTDKCFMVCRQRTPIAPDIPVIAVTKSPSVVGSGAVICLPVTKKEGGWGLTPQPQILQAKAGLTLRLCSSRCNEDPEVLRRMAAWRGKSRRACSDRNRIAQSVEYADR